jgi:hypothetical protein
MMKRSLDEMEQDSDHKESPASSSAANDPMVRVLLLLLLLFASGTSWAIGNLANSQLIHSFH